MSTVTPTTNILQNLSRSKKGKLPKKDRPKGLYLYCNSCKRKYSEQNKISCRCPELVYKAIVHVTGTRNTVKSKVFHTTDFQKAVNEFHSFKAELQKNGFQKVPIHKEQFVPERLLE